MKKKTHLTDEDQALWKAATSVIEPHKKTDAHRKKRTFKKEEESPALKSARAVAPPKAGLVARSAEASPLKMASSAKKHEPAKDLPALAKDVAQHIKTKKRGIDARLDLHGMTQEVAHRKAIAFIHAAYHNGKKTVLVITGKGSASGSDGVLQKNLSRWLAADASCAKHIAGISPAPRELGGAGAFVITLKRHNKN